MDYKYINQLLERYWAGETSLEEEQILRAFFSQANVPDELKQYRCLFIYEQTEPATDVLGDDFDEQIMSIISRPEPVKARVLTMGQRFAPLFKAAAVVAIILTLSNAAQSSFHEDDYTNVTSFERPVQGISVALNDSARTDTLKQSGMCSMKYDAPTLLK